MGRITPADAPGCIAGFFQRLCTPGAGNDLEFGGRAAFISSDEREPD
jgi:hypothetical protein